MVLVMTSLPPAFPTYQRVNDILSIGPACVGQNSFKHILQQKRCFSEQSIFVSCCQSSSAIQYFCKKTFILSIIKTLEPDATNQLTCNWVFLVGGGKEVVLGRWSVFHFAG